MADDVFALEDVKGPVAGLAEAPDERLRARLRWGESPLAAAAILTTRGDAQAAQVLAAAAAFASVEELSALVSAGAMGASSLVAVAASPWLSPNARVAAAEALGKVEPTASVVAALSQLSEGAKKPPYAQCLKAYQSLGASVSSAMHAEAEQLKTTALQVREGKRGLLRKQEVQRMVASGELPPVVGLLVGDDGDFFAGLLPPVADEARDGLVPFLLAVTRGPSEPARVRVIGMFQRRWRPLGALALGAVARTPLKGREASLGPSLVKALGTLGAADELLAIVGLSANNLRGAALAELEKLGAKGLLEADAALLRAALARASEDGDAGVRGRAQALAATALTMLEGA